MITTALTKPIQILLFFILAVIALYYTRELLIPISFGGLLAMLLLSVARPLEAKRVNRAVAALICVLLLIAVAVGIYSLLQGQLSNLLKDMDGFQDKAMQQLKKIQQFINQKFGISEQKQQELIKKQSEGGGAQAGGMVSGIISAISGTVVNTILVLVYIFLFLYFRKHLKKFILRLVPNAKRDQALTIIHKSTKVSQNYLTGLASMIVTLWVLYGIGFGLIGVKSFLFFAILCGLLEIIPFVGNLTGTAITVLFTLATGDDPNQALYVLIVYVVVQFVQSYILEPLIVGAKVNINPLFTILGLLAGELLWGIPGIILAIPVLAIVKIICDHIPQLQPYGFLIGEEEKKKEGGFTDKIMRLFGKKKSSNDNSAKQS